MTALLVLGNQPSTPRKLQIKYVHKHILGLAVLLEGLVLVSIDPGRVSCNVVHLAVNGVTNEIDHILEIHVHDTGLPRRTGLVIGIDHTASSGREVEVLVPTVVDGPVLEQGEQLLGVPDDWVKLFVPLVSLNGRLEGFLLLGKIHVGVVPEGIDHSSRFLGSSSHVERGCECITTRSCCS